MQEAVAVVPAVADLFPLLMKGRYSLGSEQGVNAERRAACFMLSCEIRLSPGV